MRLTRGSDGEVSGGRVGQVVRTLVVVLLVASVAVANVAVGPVLADDHTDDDGVIDDFNDGDLTGWANTGPMTIITDSAEGDNAMSFDHSSASSPGQLDFTGQQYEQFAFYTRTTGFDTTHRTSLYQESSGQKLVGFRYANGGIEVYDGSWTQIASISANTWYKINLTTIDWGTNTANISIETTDGTVLGSQTDVSFEGTPTNLGRFDIGSASTLTTDYDYIATNGTTFETPGSSGPSGYKQTYELDDQTGLFPADRSTLVVSTWQDSNSDEYPSESEEWSQSTTTGFNSQNESTVRLKDGDTYKLTVVSPRGDTWELIGVEANKSDGTHTLSILGFGSGTATPTPTATRTPGETPFPTATPTLASEVTQVPGTPTPTSGFGPTALGYCDVPGTDERGLEIEFWDPEYVTDSFEYELTGPDNETVYSGTKTFDEAIGYYRGCLANASLNGTDPGDVDGTYNGTREDGSTFNGSLSWAAPSLGSGGFGGGPVGSGGAASTASTYGGWLLLAAGGYLAYRRYGDGQVGAAASSAGQQVRQLVGR